MHQTNCSDKKLASPKYDWCFQSTKQRVLENRVIAQPRGRVLGGSSAINFMIAAHPSAADIDAWGRLGNAGWDWATLSAYYQRSETLQLDDHHPSAGPSSSAGAPFDRGLYGTDGPMKMSLPHGSEDEGTVDAAWRLSMAALGLAARDDPRRGDTLGAYAVLKYVDAAGGWVRSYAAKSYYEPVRDARKNNLVVRTGAHVTRILLHEVDSNSSDRSSRFGKAANAVEFEVGGEVYVARADREVILSAGAFQSPQILELSGIGHPDALKKAGIDVAVESPGVGENLQVRSETRKAYPACRCSSFLSDIRYIGPPTCAHCLRGSRWRSYRRDA